MKEQYIPSSEEVKKAEEMMSPEETKMSKDKEKHNLVVQLSELVTILAHMK